MTPNPSLIHLPYYLFTKYSNKEFFFPHCLFVFPIKKKAEPYRRVIYLVAAVSKTRAAAAARSLSKLQAKRRASGWKSSEVAPAHHIQQHPPCNQLGSWWK